MLNRLLRESSRSAIGISIETDALHMAEVRRGRMVHYADKPYPAGIAPATEAFPAFLRQSLQGFSSRYASIPVWTTVSLQSLQIRYLSLPALPARSLNEMAYWTFRKDLPFDAEQTVFDVGEECVTGSGTEAKRHVTACTAARTEVAALEAVFMEAGVKLAGVLVPAFAMRQIVARQPAATSGLQLALFVGEHASTVMIMKAGQVRLSRVFKTGMHTLLAAVRAEGEKITTAEAYSRLQKAMAAQGHSAEAGVAMDRGIVDSIQSVFFRLVQQIERTMAAYRQEHAGEIFDGVYVMGAVAGIEPLVKLLNEQLALPALPLVPPQASGHHAAVAPADERLPGVAALAAGAALSRLEATPNLLYPARQRERLARRSWWSVLAALLLALTLALLHLSRSVLGYANSALEHRIEHEQARVALYPDALDVRSLQALETKAVVDRLALKRSARRWLPLATLATLAELTPAAVRLTAVDAVFRDQETPRADRRPAGAGSQSAELVIKGMVHGPQDPQRSELAAYALNFEDSPLFAEAIIASTTDGLAGGQPVLLFEIKAATVPDIGAAATRGGTP